MDRVKQLNTYVLLLIGFFIISIILENGLIAAMYTPIGGLTKDAYIYPGLGDAGDRILGTK